MHIQQRQHSTAGRAAERSRELAINPAIYRQAAALRCAVRSLSCPVLDWTVAVAVAVAEAEASHRFHRPLECRRVPG
jgi:hypothetical protein